MGEVIDFDEMVDFCVKFFDGSVYVFHGFCYVEKLGLVEAFAFILEGWFFHGVSLPEKNEQLYKLFGGDRGRQAAFRWGGQGSRGETPGGT